jgi:phosphatidate cytidylyltransferase
MFLKRWITGLSLLPFLIFFVYQGGVLFVLLVAAACLICLWEYSRVVRGAESKALSHIIWVWGYLISLIIIWSSFWMGLQSVAVAIALNLLFVACFSLFGFKTNPAVTEIIKNQIQGIVYIPALLSFLVVIRNDAEGMTWIFFLLGIIFAGDVSALYVGSFFGRHKLCPAVSPGKTIEGSIGGLLANLTVGAVGKFIFLPQLPWTPAVIFFLAVGVAGQVGDLFESELKRSSHVKDSGGLLPGHGGLLDRIDALLFAAPVTYIFIEFIFRIKR